MERCVNIDWLEVYCEESPDRFPCNAAYFNRHGFMTKEREYGTRIYKEMFAICDNEGNPMIEIRRNPASGNSTFVGLSEFSTHIRLVNWVCYQSNAIQLLRDFLLANDYVFHRISRIDICYDFERFDSGDKPARVARRIIEKKFLKINQGRIAAHGADNWATYEWESLSWGSPSSMVTTKMYNKSKEIKAQGSKKPYIYSAWLMSGLIDNPITQVKHSKVEGDYVPEIWRVEFSIKSKADSWVVIEDNNGKKQKKVAQRHTLSMFDAPDKLWIRFQELATHYFRFKIVTYKNQKKSVTHYALDAIKVEAEKSLQRKDRMPDKTLFKWSLPATFHQLKMAAKPSKPDNQLEMLKKKLISYRNSVVDNQIRKACSIIIDSIDTNDAYRYTPHFSIWEVKALQQTIAQKMRGDERSAVEIMAILEKEFKENDIW